MFLPDLLLKTPQVVIPGKGFLGRSSTGSGPGELLDSAAARSLLGSSGRDFTTVAEAEAATYTEPEHCYVKETSLIYQYDASSTATRDGKLILNTGGAGRLVAIGGVVYDPTAGKIFLGANSVYDEVNDRLGLKIINPSATLEVVETIPNQTVLRVTGNGPRFDFYENSLAVNARNWSHRTDNVVFGDYSLWQSNAKGGDPFAAGTSRFYIKNNGYFGIGTTTPTARIHAKGSTSDSSAYALKVEDSTGKLLESLRADGLKFHDGAIARPPLTITADVTLTVATRAFLILNFAATGGVVTFPASPEDGQEFHPENIGSFSVTFARNGKLINGSASNVSISPLGNGYYKYDNASGSWWNFD